MSDPEIVARLLEGGLAGAHRSHPQEDNHAKAGALRSGNPDSTFGMPEVASASAEEALAAVAALTGARFPAEAYIDPARTIAGVGAAAGVLAEACRAGAVLIVATGHPTGLLVHHMRLVRAIARAGGKVITPCGEDVLPAQPGGRRMIKYFGGVACLSNGGDVLHTHLPGAMEHILSSGAAPDLVVADHGFAGAAVTRGIPTIAVMDTNDPALAVAQARGREITIIPMDDNRRPDAYHVVAELFEQALLGDVTGEPDQG